MKFAGETLAIIGRPIAFYPVLGEVCGGLGPGVLFCQLVYWYGKQRDPAGWIRKSWREWQAETGMSRQEQRTAKLELRRRGLVEERTKGIPATTEYRVCFAQLDADLASWLETTTQMVGINQLNGWEQPTIPETTTENTAENKDSLAPLASSALGTNERKQQDPTDLEQAANTKSKAQTKKELTAAFEHFWTFYPPRNGRRNQKAESLAAYLKLAPDPALQRHMLEAVEVYGLGTDLPVDACRWIKGRRWEDETIVRMVRRPRPPAPNPELERIAARERELGMHRG